MGEAQGRMQVFSHVGTGRWKQGFAENGIVVGSGSGRYRATEGGLVGAELRKAFTFRELIVAVSMSAVIVVLTIL